jgi:glycosyltransferase involved in cell wall biosynthesis
MVKPQVSIVIPCYNGAKFVDKTLHAIFNTTFSGFEVILIDDGSTDDTKKVLREKGWLDRVRYVYQENRGISGARNAGIKIAQGKYISLLDHDDLPLPGKLERLVSYLEGHPEFKMVYTPCILERMDKGGKCHIQNLYSSNTPRWLRKKYEGDLFENLFYMRINLSSLLMCREAALSVGLFDEAFKVFEDLEFLLRFGAQYRIGCVKDPYTIQIIHFSNWSKISSELYPKYAILAYNRYYPIMKQKSQRAKKIYREGVAAAYWGLAETLIKKGDKRDAKKYALEAIRMNPYRSKYYFRLYKFFLSVNQTCTLC